MNFRNWLHLIQKIIDFILEKTKQEPYDTSNEGTPIDTEDGKQENSSDKQIAQHIITVLMLVLLIIIVSKM